MNNTEFKHHLKDLVHGHHHPEEHDWGSGGAKKPPASAKNARTKARVKKRSSKAK